MIRETNAAPQPVNVLTEHEHHATTAELCSGLVDLGLVSGGSCAGQGLRRAVAGTPLTRTLPASNNCRQRWRRGAVSEGANSANWRGMAESGNITGLLCCVIVAGQTAFKRGKSNIGCTSLERRATRVYNDGQIHWPNGN